MRLSHLAVVYQEKRTSTVIAKSFHPEFSYHMEYSLPFYMEPSRSWPIENAPSLAEQLIDGVAIFEVLVWVW